jgi:DNA-3-methyladenine glycosylase
VSNKILPIEFYKSHNPVEIAQSLIGKILITNKGTVQTSGIITETEAYWAPDDMASHARNYTRTPRNEMMYAEAGSSYTYICYGIHTLFNIITADIDIPHAVLIRAIEPVQGIESMLKRRAMKKLSPALSSGPGSLSVAMGINMLDNGVALYDSRSAIRIEENSFEIPENEVIATPRIGVESSGKSASLPYRFIWKKSSYISAKSFSKKYF